MTKQKTKKQTINQNEFWQFCDILKKLVDDNKITAKQAKKIINKI